MDSTKNTIVPAPSERSVQRSLPTVVRLHGMHNSSIRLLRKSNKRIISPHKTGRPADPVWEFFERCGAARTGPHYIAKCNFCNLIFNRGKAHILRRHLAFECKHVSDECRAKFYTAATEDAISNDINKKRKKEESISSPVCVARRFSKIAEIGDSFDKELLRLLVCCNIPFSTVHNPVFVSFLEKLKPGISLPSKSLLLGKNLIDETTYVHQKVETCLRQQKNLTLVIECLTDSGQNIYAFIILTSDHRAFLNSLRCYGEKQNNVDFLLADTEKIIVDIGPDRICALVTESTSTLDKVRENVVEKYPNILILRSIPHYLNLIIGDILKHIWAQSILKRCHVIVSFFLEHERFNSFLSKCRDNISAPELTRFSKDNWYSASLCVKSVIKNEHALCRIVAARGADIPSNIADILTDRQFWTDTEHLYTILRPLIKIMTLLESYIGSLADCYQQLLSLAAAISSISCDSSEFQNHCKAAYILRWEELNDAIYMLAYFLHPSIRGKGVVQSMFSPVLEVAGNLWKSCGHGKASTVKLLSQLIKFRQRNEPYHLSIANEWMTPLLWWEVIDSVDALELKSLASKLLSIKPHSILYEQSFAVLRWIQSKAYNQLNIKKLEAVAKIYMFHMSCVIRTDEIKPYIVNEFSELDVIDVNEGFIFKDENSIFSDESIVEYAMSDSYFEMWNKLSETFDLQGTAFNDIDEQVNEENPLEAVVEILVPEDDTEFEIEEVLATVPAEDRNEHSYLEFFE